MSKQLTSSNKKNNKEKSKKEIINNNKNNTKDDIKEDIDIQQLALDLFTMSCSSRKNNPDINKLSDLKSSIIFLIRLCELTSKQEDSYEIPNQKIWIKHYSINEWNKQSTFLLSENYIYTYDNSNEHFSIKKPFTIIKDIILDLVGRIRKIEREFDYKKYFVQPRLELFDGIDIDYVIDFISKIKEHFPEEYTNNKMVI
jgi:hypothetical protein